ncbi:MAG: cysteine hydrolase [Nitrososphaerota archaeon]|jgi:nicotinamidase-related amidase|nr:cysteine hydrolase [Nitrososphaerota archaeon]MDG6930613.1 cysteine hydrolase [Nitrososphaerota archaeon]MDG6932762.1 cysteine hydrolase [Nitrososphaerota archaeon]MDG6935849.1 cysteine hydrolase [Nitrososphaerota archaeon]MDG6944170.1 cysteine hydrolase [Nitrososphaerota archaeon]
MSRIYKGLKEIVAPGHTALIVWDVQKMLVNVTFNREEFLKNINDLIEGARRVRLPVFFTMIDPLPPAFQSPASLSMGRTFNVQDRSAFELALKPLDGEIVVKKNTASLFIGTNVELMLRNAGIDTIIIAGISTEIGVESSARDAANRGFYPVVVSDSSSSSDKAAHERSLENMKRLGVVTEATTKDIISAWA